MAEEIITNDVVEEPIDQVETFDPNSLEFEDTYEFHGYNIEAFKDHSKEE